MVSEDSSPLEPGRAEQQPLAVKENHYWRYENDCGESQSIQSAPDNIVQRGLAKSGNDRLLAG
jgi:hypothetical protein